MFSRKPQEIRTIEDLKSFIKEFFSGKPVKVYLFGSRARGDNTPHSDIDIAVESEVDVRIELTELREILEESLLPYKVDIVDLRGAPYLKETVEREGVRWL